MKKISTRNKYLLGMGIMLFAFIAIGISYSFYKPRLTKINDTETVIKTNELGLVYTGPNNVSCANMIPGDKCIKHFTIENTSEVAITYNIYMEQITNEFNEDLVYTLTDNTGNVVEETSLPATNSDKSYLKKGIEINAKGTKNYTITIEYKYTNQLQDYQGAEFRGTIGIDTVQNENSNNNSGEILCKRATELHSNYGNLGTKGTLASGDAFDCDVNGDGTYDAATERFYYVSSLYTGGTTGNEAWDTNIAVLIYYNNVSGGVADNTVGYAYNVNSVNYEGPDTSKVQLPTISQWNNVKLSNTTRSILNEFGGNTSTNDRNPGIYTLPDSYSYEGYAARLVTYQELVSACGNNLTGLNSLYNCSYLIENTYLSSQNYKGYWLETPRAPSTNEMWVTDGVWVVTGNNHNLNYDYTSITGYYGVRPVIEVPISNIEV